MTISDARRWLISASLFVTGASFVFFLVAPAVGYPLTWEQSTRVFEVVLPVFLGYLGSATHFVFHGGVTSPVTLPKKSEMLGLLVKGPIIVFGVAAIAILFAFGWTNRAAAQGGTGMTVEKLSGAFTAALGLLAVTTNVAVSYLFSLGEKSVAEPKVVEDGKQS